MLGQLVVTSHMKVMIGSVSFLERVVLLCKRGV